MEDIIKSFDRRCDYFEQESTWCIDSQLNAICTKLVKSNYFNEKPIKLLDYGCGKGDLSRLLSADIPIVDVADISQSMLDNCTFARNRYLIPHNTIEEQFDRIILRQVLQYFKKSEWKTFLSSLMNLLVPKGVLVFSQIVPYNTFDFGFWHELTSTRRPQRRSFPIEVDFFHLCDVLNFNVIDFITSFTYQSYIDWVKNEPVDLQENIKSIFFSASAIIRGVWNIDFRESGDISFRNRWVHIVISKKEEGSLGK